MRSPSASEARSPAAYRSSRSARSRRPSGRVVSGVSISAATSSAESVRGSRRGGRGVSRCSVGSRETPQIEVHLIEQLGGQSSTDARGIAEPANVATAAAIANAFFNATGKRILELPLTPANVLAALRSAE